MKIILMSAITLSFFSLILMPAYYAGTKLIKTKELSFGAAFLLFLVAGVAVQACSLILPVMPSTNILFLDYALSLCLYTLVVGFIFGYFVRNENGHFIGLGKGMVLSVVFVLVGALMLPTLSVIVGNVINVVF